MEGFLAVVEDITEQKVAENKLRETELRYQHEEPADAAPPTDDIEPTAAMLAELPPELIKELDKTTLVANREAILKVIERIEEHAPDAAKHLRELVHNFELERIRELLTETGEGQ